MNWIYCYRKFHNDSFHCQYSWTLDAVRMAEFLVTDCIIINWSRMKTTWFGMQVQSRKNRIINKIVMHKLLKCLLLDRKVENALKAKTGGFSSSSIFFTHQIDILISYASRVNVHKNCVFFLHLLLNFFCNRKSLQMFLPPKLRSRIFLPKSKYGRMLEMHCFYRTRVRSLFTHVSNWLTDWLTHSCSVNLIDVTLACEDANSKLFDVVTVADVDDEDRVGNSLLQISKLRFGQKAKLLFRLWAQGLVKILMLKFRQDLRLASLILLIFCRGYELESWSGFRS